MNLSFTWEIDDVLTDVTSAKLSDPDGTYGVKRDDTDAVLVADGTDFTNPSTGTYLYALTEPEAGLTYTYCIEVVYNGETYHRSRTVTGAAVEPVTAAQCKLWAHIDTDADDTSIGFMITAARIWAEGYRNECFLTATKTELMSWFPSVIVLPWSPLISVTSITYIDAGGTEQTLASSVYEVDTDSEPGEIHLAYGETWPSVRGDHKGITVTYKAGYGVAADVPSNIKAAIMMLVAGMDCNREPSAPVQLYEVPFSVKALLGMDRKVPI